MRHVDHSTGLGSPSPSPLLNRDESGPTRLPDLIPPS